MRSIKPASHLEPARPWMPTTVIPMRGNGPTGSTALYPREPPLPSSRTSPGIPIQRPASRGRCWHIRASFMATSRASQTYFFERIRPIIEAELSHPDPTWWPLITLNLDIKTEEWEHLRAIFGTLQAYQRMADHSYEHSQPRPRPASAPRADPCTRRTVGPTRTDLSQRRSHRCASPGLWRGAPCLRQPACRSRRA
jgi:hypothetical protein